jgi:hypothetical protein
MSERHSVSSTAEQGKMLPTADHTALFTRDEVFAALQQLVPTDEATAIVDELYSAEREPGSVFFYGDLLTALSALSESAAERARSVVAPPESERPPAAPPPP